MKIYQSLIREVPPLSPTYYGNNFKTQFSFEDNNDKNWQASGSKKFL